MKFKIVLFLIFTFNFSFAQTSKIINNEATSFQLKDKNDNIDFIVLDTKLETKKPVFLFCQGSLPYPLFVNSKKDGIWIIGGGVSNFDVEKIKKYYHLIIISDPKTPLIADESQINDSY
jgi:hypothetical protein